MPKTQNGKARNGAAIPIGFCAIARFANEPIGKPAFYRRFRTCPKIAPVSVQVFAS